MKSSTRAFIVAGLLVTAALALFVSPWASSQPDGLQRVSIDKGFSEDADDHAFVDGPVANYSVKGVDDSRLSTALSGLIGVLLTFGIGLGLFGLLRRNRSDEPPTGEGAR